jgi:mono/diheme cytochrome c family protein
MKRRYRTLALAGASLLLSLPAAGALAQPEVDRGKREFLNSCAVCHGAEASGDGPLRPYLVRPPTDLTTLARRNGGAFPTRRVMDIIDGRDEPRIGSHGPREMPVWGDVFLEQAQRNSALAKMHPEWSVRVRITALVDYLRALQAK